MFPPSYPVGMNEDKLEGSMPRWVREGEAFFWGLVGSG